MTRDRHDPPILPGSPAYDEQHLDLYLRLLIADEEGADWREVVAVLFKIDPVCEPVRARAVYDNHLARARWMTKAGYRHLLEPRLQ
ncbi:DUF2285 domain-containing protein [Gluconobacter sp. R75690]|uniref:DNA -binding domain-containing protein n=1 Tax=Gluconobacter TaxID=441 RepID=UPI00188C9B71|nr:DUF2285 domain-containing protein [Gluconobacter sp. R75690]MBF0880298.1 DUF2285 domain-containing protein [Gluconobacter sp. R75828]